MVENGRLIPLASYTSVAGGVPALTPEERRVCLADTCFAFDETRGFLEDCDGMRRAGEPGACTINRPCAQQYVGKYQSCMVISGRLIVHADFFYAVRVRQCICGAVAGETNTGAFPYNP